MNPILETIPPIAALAKEADVIDVKTFYSEADLRQFVAGMICHEPWWIRFLYGVRKFFVPLLGLKQAGIPKMPKWKPADVPMQRGEMAAFFTVQAAEEDHFWLAGITDEHLAAYLGVIADDSEPKRRYSVITLVMYRHWTGPVYFNVIRPFHHVVVGSMGRAGARAG